MKKSEASPAHLASGLISERIAELGDWRGKTLGRIRKLILDTDSRIVEEWKWMGTPVWSRNGIICTGETYEGLVKITFIKGAALKDPKHIFNASLVGNARRAIDIHEDEKIDEPAFKALIKQAISLNSSSKSKASQKAKTQDLISE